MIFCPGIPEKTVQKWAVFSLQARPHLFLLGALLDLRHARAYFTIDNSYVFVIMESVS